MFKPLLLSAIFSLYTILKHFLIYLGVYELISEGEVLSVRGDFSSKVIYMRIGMEWFVHHIKAGWW